MTLSLSSLRIAQVMLSSGFGGAERLFVDICQHLAEAGHRVQAVCHPEFVELKQLEHDRITVTTLKARWDFSPLARNKMRRALRNFQPNVIHTHLARGSMIAGSAAASLSIPVAANLHDYVKLKYYRKIDHFFPGTQHQKSYLMRHGVEQKDITVIPHFSRLTVASTPKDPRDFSHNTPVFTAFGRFAPEKGFPVLLQSIKMLHNDGLKARLILGGDGPQRGNLLELINTLGLKDFVTLPGWIDDTARFLDQSPFFVLPSWHEPFGIVILEAMARGNVIISTRVQGPREILDDSTAFLAEPGDPESLAATMRKAWHNQDEAAAKAKKAWLVYQDQYAPEKIIPLFEQKYREMTAK